MELVNKLRENSFKDFEITELTADKLVLKGAGKRGTIAEYKVK